MLNPVGSRLCGQSWNAKFCQTLIKINEPRLFVTFAAPCQSQSLCTVRLVIASGYLHRSSCLSRSLELYMSSAKGATAWSLPDRAQRHVVAAQILEPAAANERDKTDTPTCQFAVLRAL